MADGALSNSYRHIVLNSHPRSGGREPANVVWGAAEPKIRGPVVGTVSDTAQRDAIGALAGGSGSLSVLHKPDLTDTAPAISIGSHPQWADPGKIVSLDPYGHLIGDAFADELEDGVDIRPTIAVTKARLTVPEFQELMPDVLDWLGFTRIGRLASMSDMKYDSLAGQGIEVGERVAIPKERIPDDAKVETDAKKAAGNFADMVASADELASAKGRGLGAYENA